MVRSKTLDSVVVFSLVMVVAGLSATAHADTQWRIAPDVIFKSQWLSDTDLSPS